jgi:hypothetical protein
MVICLDLLFNWFHETTLCALTIEHIFMCCSAEKYQQSRVIFDVLDYLYRQNLTKLRWPVIVLRFFVCEHIHNENE